MESGQIVPNLLVMLVTFLFAAFFVACEFALVQSRPSALEEMIDNGTGRKAKVERALRMVHNLNEYLSTTQVGVSLAGIILGWIGETTVEFLLVDLFGLTHLSLPNGSSARSWRDFRRDYFNLFRSRVNRNCSEEHLD